jgi:hypothetical protein
LLLFFFFLFCNWIRCIPPSPRRGGADGESESRSRSHALHASLTVIAMHINDIAPFITLPVAAVLVVTLVLLIATVVLVTLALRRDGD